MSLSKVIEVARADLGYTEDPPGSNRTKYWQDYDPAYQGQPWCVAFLWWCFREAGESAAFFGGAKTASCGKLLRFFKENYQNVPVREIAVGDLGFFNFSGGVAPEHCGLITHVERNGGSILYVKSIEGNTYAEGGSGDDSNGGCVAERTRYPRNIVGAARPKYKEEEPMPKDDITGHWAEQSIRRVMGHGFLKGYPDGTFRPEQPVTRAELAVILDRLLAQECPVSAATSDCKNG